MAWGSSCRAASCKGRRAIEAHSGQPGEALGDTLRLPRGSAPMERGARSLAVDRDEPRQEAPVGDELEGDQSEERRNGPQKAAPLGARSAEGDDGEGPMPRVEEQGYAEPRVQAGLEGQPQGECEN